MTDFWRDSPELSSRLERVVAAIDAALANPDFPLASQVAEVARANGKLLRPALLLIGSGFGKIADEERIERLASTIELLHVATLIHDDIIDEADTRRGRPSLHASIGVKEAVLAGDWLFSQCFLLASEGASPENAKGLSRLMAAICSAEIGQDLSKYGWTASVRDCKRIMAGKTAALFSLALYAGASEAKAGRRVEQTLRRAGYDIGMAFQVIDDILDYESSEQAMRKPVGKDIAEGLCTLPLVYALREDRVGMGALLAKVSESPPVEAAEAAAAAAARAIELGGPDRARRDARVFTDRALREIARLPALPPKTELERLSERLLARAN
jgi:Geranylgeranyl pyrophosphate synthase